MRLCFSRLSQALAGAGLLLAGLALASPPPLTTLALVQATLAAIPNCLRYHVIGICFWQVCVGDICTVTTTLKVDHYLPDAVITVFNEPPTDPWDYANHVIDPLALKVGQGEVKQTWGLDLGYGQENTHSVQDVDTHVKEIDLIGHPAITLFAKPHLFLPSPAQPFMPYYLSLADSLAQSLAGNAALSTIPPARQS